MYLGIHRTVVIVACIVGIGIVGIVFIEDYFFTFRKATNHRRHSLGYNLLKIIILNKTLFNLDYSILISFVVFGVAITESKKVDFKWSAGKR